MTESWTTGRIVLEVVILFVVCYAYLRRCEAWVREIRECERRAWRLRQQENKEREAAAMGRFE